MKQENTIKAKKTPEKLSRDEMLKVYEYMKTLPVDFVASLSPENGAKVVSEATNVVVTKASFYSVRKAMGIQPIRTVKIKENKEKKERKKAEETDASLFTLKEIRGLLEAILECQKGVLNEIIKFNK